MTPSLPVVSGSTTSASQRLLQVQAVSGAAFAVFLAVHLVNQALAVLGPAGYDAAQRTTRSVYQAPLVELLLVALPLAVHVAAAAARLLFFRLPTTAGPWRVRGFRVAGRFLLLVIAGHVVATRGASLSGAVPEGPRFEGLAFTFQWQPALFWPYYLLLAGFGLWHLAHGLSVGARLVGRPWLEGRSFWLVLGVGAALLVAGVVAVGSGVFDVGDPMSSPYARWVLSW
ncbi:MAG: hypothetical protein SFW67_35855 [Myxococcaceae bacterium]|nr:hypothetical protein [Myxococcaceae bacterium]